MYMNMIVCALTNKRTVFDPLTQVMNINLKIYKKYEFNHHVLTIRY